MIFDLEKDGGRLEGRVYDVCIGGSGPAGITLARTLAKAGFKVLLLEAGGYEYSERSQKHYAGTESGISTFGLALTGSRLRYFGGTSNHWAGMCGVFGEAAFAENSYHTMPGWPIALPEVLKYQSAATAILDLPESSFRPGALGGGLDNAFLRTGIQFSPPTRFAQKYRAEIESSQFIDLYINANIVDVELQTGAEPNSKVGRFIVSNYQGKRFKAVGKHYVLALGSLENARILLNSDRQRPNGIGNHSDYVGRCYMEHLNVPVGRFVLSANNNVITNDTNLSPTVATTTKLKTGDGILSLDVNGAPTFAGRLAPLRHLFRNLTCESDTIRDFARKFKDFECSGDGLISSMFEQAPDRNNRVQLGNDVDDLGLRRIHLHWALSDADRHTIRSLSIELAKVLAEANVARVQLRDYITNPKIEIDVFSHAHQMGTTRMSADPANGVVDTNCRVHGLSNLYMAGSSVFSTGGGINPTLTIVMMALRLANHIETTLRKKK